MTSLRTQRIMIVLGIALLAACARGTKNGNPGAGSGATSSTITLAQQDRHPPRPSAALGMYTSLYLAQHGFLPVTSALAGVQAESKLTTTQTPETMDDSYAMLQEFGTILQVDIADILNRSQDRPTTLNEYLTGLSNITTRAQRRHDDLAASVEQLTGNVRQAGDDVSTMQRSITDALAKHDYETAGEQQKTLIDAQTKLAKVQADQHLTQQIVNTFQQLIAVANKRKAAIEENREVLIAGLKVVDVPGIEDLGILNGAKGTKRSSGLLNFGF
ncbi:hypothetical protein HY285_01795 [Candidatus Peregrinibacteria bacterium]|nr:hypothetical protein [Candidatus Peregrinibacteria bacterium]MBI3816260.1 hypothetical protein [Candidatus Peregrinibacteria bacterium]